MPSKKQLKSLQGLLYTNLEKCQTAKDNGTEGWQSFINELSAGKPGEESVIDQLSALKQKEYQSIQILCNADLFYHNEKLRSLYSGKPTEVKTHDIRKEYWKAIAALCHKTPEVNPSTDTHSIASALQAVATPQLPESLSKLLGQSESKRLKKLDDQSDSVFMLMQNFYDYLRYKISHDDSTADSVAKNGAKIFYNLHPSLDETKYKETARGYTPHSAFIMYRAGQAKDEQTGVRTTDWDAIHKEYWKTIHDEYSKLLKKYPVASQAEKRPADPEATKDQTFNP